MSGARMSKRDHILLRKSEAQLKQRIEEVSAMINSIVRGKKP